MLQLKDAEQCERQYFCLITVERPPAYCTPEEETEAKPALKHQIVLDDKSSVVLHLCEAGKFEMDVVEKVRSTHVRGKLTKLGCRLLEILTNGIKHKLEGSSKTPVISQQQNDAGVKSQLTGMTSQASGGG